jgi:hypothetical protein
MALIVLIKSCFLKYVEKPSELAFTRLKLLNYVINNPNGMMKIMMMLQKFLSICDRKNYYVLYIDLVNYKRVFRIF